MYDPGTPDDIERDTIAEWVAISDMFVDKYQRNPSEAKINAMVRSDEFDPDALGVICLSLRNKGQPFAGRYAIVDGNHRVECCKKLGITHIFARVYIDLTYAQEALLYERLNNRHRITAYHMFRSRLERKELAALEIRDMLAAYGLKLTAKADAPGSISSVSALDRLYNECGPAGFEQVVGIIHESWTTERRAWITAMIEGIKQFWIRYQTDVDRDRLIDRLRMIHPEDILRNASVGLAKRGSPGTRVGRELFETYNHGLRSSRLPEWVDFPGKGFEGRGRAKPGTPGDDDPPPAAPPTGRPRRRR
jgi:hypothetical protein